MATKLYSSPLQGFTDFRFRKAFNSHFGGIDLFYAPYIRLNNQLEIKRSYQRDLLPENNINVNLQPQVMTRDADEFLFVANYVQQQGYTELNWNLGCPYPMVTKRGMGAGLIQKPKVIEEVLHKVFSESNIEVSIKMRLGNESKDEIFEVLPILEKFPIKHLCIHPRIGKQLYKGKVDLEFFQRCIESTKQELHYNGDIGTVSKFKELSERFPIIKNWWLGRGIISDPFLANMIKQNSYDYPEDWLDTFSNFHNTLLEDYRSALSGDKHLILKMFQFWEYFISLFPNTPKGLKKIKKAKDIHAYEFAVKEILSSSSNQL